MITEGVCLRHQNMKNSILKSLLLPFAFLLVVQLILGPVAATAQIVPINISEESEKKRRLDEAALAKAEAEARKAQADADKVESDIAKQNLETRKTQLELIKSTTTVEGNLVENNIAASKAIGCAAEEIALDLFTTGGVSTPDYVLLYTPGAAASLSEYSAIRVQSGSTINAYKPARDALEAKLQKYMQEDDAALDQRINDLQDEIDKIKAQIEAEKKKPNSRTKTAMLQELNEQLAFKAAEFLGAVEAQNVSLTNTFKAQKVADFLTSSTPVGMAIDAALNLFALFRTDTTLKGHNNNPRRAGPHRLLVSEAQSQEKRGGHRI